MSEELPGPFVASVACVGDYQHHLQGICLDDHGKAIYWSFTTELVKTDRDGKVLKKIPVANHHGDLCFHDGKLFVAVNLGRFNDPKGNADSWVYVYDAASLEFLGKHATPEVFHGAGGIGIRDGKFFVVGGLPDGVEKNYVYEYDAEFRFVKKHVIASGWTRLGIQTAAWHDGAWWFGCYGSPKILLKTDADFKMLGRFEFDCSLGIAGAGPGRFLVAKGPRTPEGRCLGSAHPAVPDDEQGLRITSSDGDAATKEKRYAFFITGDPQYHAVKTAEPAALDPYSEAAATRFLERIRAMPGSAIPDELGGGTVSRDILGLIVSGDLIDSCDKNGTVYPAMQRFEWDRYVADFGLTGKDGKLPWPVYEVHGNHDGPQGDTFVIDAIIERNERRPAVGNISANGLHYSWDWGPLHGIALGMFVGEGESRREDHHYAPRGSLGFLRADLEKQVGDSGRPVMIVFHLHPNGPEFDWPGEDLAAFWKAIENYNVIALIHGHTHGSPPKRLMWDGKDFGRELAGGIDIFDPDDSAAAKTDPRDPDKGMGLAHGFLYAELIDVPGTENDRFVVRSYFTKDNWATQQWGEVWERRVSLGGGGQNP